MLAQKIYHGIGSLLNLLHLNLKRSYNLLALVISVSSIMYFLYAWLSASQKSLSLQLMLHKNPSLTVTAIVAGINIIVAYSLWNYRNQIMKDRNSFEIALISLIIQQICLGNIIAVLFATSSLYYRSEIKLNRSKKLGGLISAVTVTTIIYAFCLWVMFRLKF